VIQWISKSVSQLVSKSVGKNLLERSLVIEVSKVSMVSELRRLKASKPGLYTNSYELYDFRYFAAFSADSVHLKKPSRWPKALIGPPCHGAPGWRRQN